MGAVVWGGGDDDPLVTLVRQRAAAAVRPGTAAWAQAEDWLRAGTPGEAVVARAVLFDGLLPLLLVLASRYERRAELSRLLRVGLPGVHEAVARWDPRKGFRLDTFATWWVRQAITRDLTT